MCGKPKEANQVNRGIEGMALEGTLAPDDQTLDMLTGEGGPLHAGSVPGSDLTPEAEKALWEAMEKQPLAKPKPKPHKNEKDAEEMVPKTVKESLVPGNIFETF